MKITIQNLRRIIRETIKENALREGVDKSIPGVTSWIGFMVRDGDFQGLGQAWDRMCEFVRSGGTFMSSRDPAVVEIADEFGIDPAAVSFHLRKLVSNPRVRSGNCPTGANMAAEALKQREEMNASRDRMNVNRPKQDPTYDPYYGDAPKLLGGGRRVGD